MESKIKSIRSLCVSYLNMYESTVERKDVDQRRNELNGACVHSKTTMARTNATITRERNYSWLSG